MQGTRVDKQPHLLAPGEYTHHKWRRDDNGEEMSAWYACSPNGQLANLGAHTITEHDDGTITVSPSIGIGWRKNGAPYDYHGYIEKGVWRDA